MRKNLIIFGIIAAIWIPGYVIFGMINSPDLVEEQGMASTLGQAMGSLVYPLIGFLIYLFIRGSKKKIKSKI